jgi:hypothetical protein
VHAAQNAFLQHHNMGLFNNLSVDMSVSHSWYHVDSIKKRRFQLQDLSARFIPALEQTPRKLMGLSENSPDFLQ